jgi:hypothetical protein
MENGKEAPDFPAKKAQNGAKYPVFCPFFQSPMLIPLDLRNGARRVLSKNRSFTILQMAENKIDIQAHLSKKRTKRERPPPGGWGTP